MNQPSREQIEARITALLLGELPATEAELLRWTIAQDADLQKLHDELKSTIILVRETVKPASTATADKNESLRLSGERRGKLLAHFKTPRPVQSFWLKRIEVPSLIPALVAVAIIALLAAMLLPALSKAKSKSQHLTTLGGSRGTYSSGRLSSGDNSEREEMAASAPPATAPATVTLAPEPVLAPPPVQIVLPSAEPSASAAPATGSLADGGNVGMSFQNAGGYVNTPFSSPPVAALPPGGSAPPAVKVESGQLAFDKREPLQGKADAESLGRAERQSKLPAQAVEASGSASVANGFASIGGYGGFGGGGGAGGTTAQQPAKNIPNGALDQLGVEPPAAALNSPSSTTMTWNTSDVDHSRSENPPGATGTTFAVRAPATGVYRYMAPVQPADANKVALAGDVPVLGRLFQNSTASGAVAPSSAIPSAAGPEENDSFSDERKKSLQDQFVEQSKGIQLTQQKVEALRQELHITDQATMAGPTPTLDNQQLQMINQQAVEGQRLYKEQFVQLQELKSIQTNNPQKLREVLPQVVHDAALNELLAKHKEVGQTLVTTVQAKSLKDELNHEIDDRVSGIMSGLEAQVDAKKAALDNLATAAESAKQEDQVEAKKNQPYYDAKQELEQKMQTHEMLYSKLEAEKFDRSYSKAKPASAPAPQPEILTRENAFSTFSLNVSDVSFKLAAARLEKGQLPEPASIRSEEFINAFDYRDPEAAPGQPLAFAAERARYPFAHNRDLLRFSIKTAAAGRPAGRGLNLVLLLDTSGSMERADRVAIIREALRVLAAQLQPQDTVSVVTFARTARLWADGVPGNQAGETLSQVGGITPDGGTNLEEALRLAYETARRHYLAGGMNRVALLTDGAANLGKVDPAGLKQKVEAQRRQGIALDCFGIGWEDFNDDMLEQLSGNGDGRYAFINSPEDAAKDFTAKLAGALQVAAQDVKVQVEFNPQRVVSWRQIGYAKHLLSKEQFRDNSVIAGEIAAQEAGNALYTIETRPDGIGPVATVYVRYRIPGAPDVHERSWAVDYNGTAPALEQASPAMRLAATTAAFSEWLAASPFAQEITADELLKDLGGVPQIYGADQRPAKLEWMIRQAKSLAGK